jgi:hypothetical protein
MEELILFVSKFVQPNEEEPMHFLQLMQTGSCTKGKSNYGGLY